MRRLRGSSGSTLVETAFSIAILLTLLVGFTEAGLMVYTYHFISNAAREGTRYAMVRGSTWSEPPWNAGACGAAYTNAGCIASGDSDPTTNDNIQDYVKSLVFPGINPSQIQVNTTWYPTPGATACSPACNAAGDVVQVQVQYTFPVTIPFIPKKSLTMSSTSQMVISQ